MIFAFVVMMVTAPTNYVVAYTWAKKNMNGKDIAPEIMGFVGVVLPPVAAVMALMEILRKMGEEE